jgi:hypothetical protein
MKFKTAIDGKSLVVTGLSRTQIAHFTESGGTPITAPNPDIEKTIYSAGQAPTHPSQAIRRPNTATRGDSGAILRDASALGKAPVERTPSPKAERTAPPKKEMVDRSAPGANRSRRV